MSWAAANCAALPSRRFRRGEVPISSIARRLPAAALHERGEREGEERHESGPLVPVPNLGEEAFWVGSHLSGALYVLHGDAILLLSLGGIERPEQRLERAARLAYRALARLVGP